jgi:hypothetical protein
LVDYGGLEMKSCSKLFQISDCFQLAELEILLIFLCTSWQANDARQKFQPSV